MRSFAMVGVFVGLVLGAGCAQPSAQDCPDDKPAACPSPAPTFSADVSPLIQKYCAGCHSPDGEESKTPLVDYSSITGPMDRIASMVETQLVGCKMPLPGEPQPTPEERRIILGWLVCGAQDN